MKKREKPIYNRQNMKYSLSQELSQFTIILQCLFLLPFQPISFMRTGVKLFFHLCQVFSLSPSNLCTLLHHWAPLQKTQVQMIGAPTDQRMEKNETHIHTPHTNALATSQFTELSQGLKPFQCNNPCRNLIQNTKLHKHN